MSVTVRGARRLTTLYQHHLTPPGRALLLALLVAAGLRMGALSPPLYAALAFLAALLAVAVLSGLPFRPRVHARRRLHDNPTAGRPWFYEVVVENRSRRPARDLVVEEIKLPKGLVAAPAEEPLPRLDPGARAVLSLGLTAPRRGAYELPALQAATLFPTGLVKPSRYLDLPERLVVHPRFDCLVDFELPPGGRRDDGGRAQRREGEDFAGLREWREGDRPRDVHWRAYARTGRLVVRETVDEGRASVALVLDTSCADPKNDATFEAAVSKAAAIAEVLLRQGRALDLVLAGPTAHRLEAEGPRALPAILDLLAMVEPGQGIDAERLLAEASGLSVVIVVQPRDAAEPHDLLQALEARGLATRTVLGEAQ
jgi:uncharacterized protein (DUF58 family)